MANLHLVCRDSLNLHATKFPEFESGFWDFTEEDAGRLVGGMLFLHDAKGKPSYFGGQVSAYRLAEAGEKEPGRIVFTLVSKAEGKAVAWEGAKHAVAWNGGLVG
jgi:hypothetical protein